MEEVEDFEVAREFELTAPELVGPWQMSSVDDARQSSLSLNATCEDANSPATKK